MQGKWQKLGGKGRGEHFCSEDTKESTSMNGKPIYRATDGPQPPRRSLENLKPHGAPFWFIVGGPLAIILMIMGGVWLVWMLWRGAW